MTEGLSARNLELSPEASTSRRFSTSESPMPGSSVSQMTRGRPRRSQVWQCFIYDETENKSECQMLTIPTTDLDSSDICGHKVTGKFPSNLKLHLKSIVL